MSGVPYGAAMSGASGLFQGRVATFFLTCSVAQWSKLKGGGRHLHIYLNDSGEWNGLALTSRQYGC